MREASILPLNTSPASAEHGSLPLAPSSSIVMVYKDFVAASWKSQPILLDALREQLCGELAVNQDRPSSTNTAGASSALN
jgi:hypothetical protein